MYTNNLKNKYEIILISYYLPLYSSSESDTEQLMMNYNHPESSKGLDSPIHDHHQYHSKGFESIHLYVGYYLMMMMMKMISILRIYGVALLS